MHRSGTAMAWNVFKFCTALRGLGSVMILLVLGIVGVTYYALVLCNYGPALLAATGALDALVALAVLLIFHFLVRPRPALFSAFGDSWRDSAALALHFWIFGWRRWFFDLYLEIHLVGLSFLLSYSFRACGLLQLYLILFIV